MPWLKAVSRDVVPVVALGLLVATGGVALAGPPTGHGSTTAAHTVRTRLDAAHAKLAAAHARHAALQARVAGLERQNATAVQQLDARNARIAELQRKLAAAGAPASAASSGH